ncbi:hypothetical protein JST97_10290 [bacterium]|nr:hypothetical protein [bacterium]
MKNLGPVLLVVLLMAVALWSRPWANLDQSENPRVEVTTEASSLSDAVRAELMTELKFRQFELDRFQVELKQAEEHPGQSMVVSPAKVEEVLKALDRLEALLRDPALDGQQLRRAREEIRELWRERATSLRQYLLSGERGSLPELPRFDHSLASLLNGSSESQAYQSQYHRLRDQWKRLAARQAEAFQADLSGRFDRLARGGRLRYRLLQRLAALNWVALFESPGPWLEDCLFELSCYPDRKYALFLLARAQLEKRTGGGGAVWVALAVQAGQALLGLILLSSCLIAADRRDRLSPEGLRGVWTWLAVWPVCQLGLYLVSGGVLECLRPIFVLGGLYAIYRAYLQLARGPVLQAIVHSRVGQKVGVHTRARRDLTLWGRAIWLGWTCDALLLALGGPGLLAVTSESAVDLMIKLLYWLLSWNWRAELGQALSVLLPGPPNLARWVGDLCASPLLGLVLAPLAVPVLLLLSGLHWLVRRTVRYDWAKRMSAGVLRRWMESNSQGQGLEPVPPSYREAFLALPWSWADSWLVSNPTFCAHLEGAVRNWRAGQSQSHSLVAVHGPDGSGRKQVVEHLQSVFGSDLQVVRMEVSERLTNQSQLLLELARALSLEPSQSLDEMASRLRGLPPTLLIVPRAERLFLARLGGFEAIDQFHRLMLLGRANIFCCLLFPTQSLRYLRLVVNERWTIPLSLRLPRWSEAGLQAMLLARHAAAGGELLYSSAVQRAAEATPGVSPQACYFHILREVAAGNPSVACELWLEAARLDEQSRVVIELPPRKPVHLLAGLPSAAVWVLAAVVRHGELSLEEAVEVTALPANQLFTAWEHCQELGVLVGEGSLSVNRSWLADVTHFLKERNLLDGE